MGQTGASEAGDLGEFDHIVVGAGSAGCVLADRLSANGRHSVLVLEAGGNDDWIWFHIPVGYLFAIGNPRADWLFKTQAEPGLNGRALNYPRGRVIGGCSAINAMIYMRGQAADYDSWRQMGLTGWGWDDVLPHFLRQEDHAGPPDPLHGKGGGLRVDFPRMRWDLLDAVQEAGESLGIPRIADFNRGSNEGSSYFQVNQKNGRRWSAARGFLKPALKRPNLRLETDVLVERVVIEGGRATGVRLRRGGQVLTARARREVVLAAGAIGSPHLLELSGIGDGARLQGLGIAPVLNRPGVGENLQDHLQLRPVFKVEGVATLNMHYRQLWRRAWMGLHYALARRGPLTMAPSQLGLFTRSSPAYEQPNLQFHIQPLSLDRFGEPMHDFPAFTASVCNLRPTSRGTVHAVSPDAATAPAIAPLYLSTPEDRQVAVDAIRLTRRLVSVPALARYRPQEYRPGAHLTGDGELVQAAGDIGTTIFHPVGTARMGLRDDLMAVTDERLRVIGIDGLRVVDASVMPRITSGNTNAPTMMIAEKGAAMILEEA